MVLNKKVWAQLEAALEGKDEHHVVYIPISFLALGNPTNEQQCALCAPSGFGLDVTAWLKERYRPKIFIDRADWLHEATGHWIAKLSKLQGIELVAKFPENGDRIDELLKKKVPQKVIELLPGKVEEVVAPVVVAPEPVYPVFEYHRDVEKALDELAGADGNVKDFVQIRVRLDGDLRYPAISKRHGSNGNLPGAKSGLVYNYLVKEGYDVQLVANEPQSTCLDWLKRHNLMAPSSCESNNRRKLLFPELMLKLSATPGAVNNKWEVGVLSQGGFYPPTEQHYYPEVVDSKRHVRLRQVTMLVPERSVILVKAVPDLLRPRFAGYVEKDQFPKSTALREGMDLLNALSELHHIRVETRNTDLKKVVPWLESLRIRYHSLVEQSSAPALPVVSFSQIHLKWLNSK